MAELIEALLSSMGEIASTGDAPGQQWIHLLNLGSNKGQDGRGPFLVEDPQAIIDRSFTTANTDKLAVDYNHAIDIKAPYGEETPAAGWISRMEVRADGIWGLVEWTPKAAQAVKSKEYRYISPVIYHLPDGRVVSIARASLTNNPNLTLKALNSAQKGTAMDDMELITELRAALGLAEDAPNDAILAAVKKAQTVTNNPDPARFVPIKLLQDTMAELNRVSQGASQAQAEMLVEKAMQQRKLAPFMKDWAISLCTANRAAFDDFIDGTGAKINEFVDELVAPSKLTAARLSALDGQGGLLTETDIKLGLSENDIKARAAQKDF